VKTGVRLFKKHWANIVRYFRYRLSNAPDGPIGVRIHRMLQPVDLHAVLEKLEGQVGENGSFFGG
jgi:hypothetical protein